MKKAVLYASIISMTVFTALQAQDLKGKSVNINDKVTIKNTALGAGGQVSFVLTNIPQPAFGFGCEFLIELTLTPQVVFQLDPNILFWFTGKDENSNPSWWDEWHVRHGQIGINLLDLKFLIPVGMEKVVQPYAGVGPAMVINTEAVHQHHFATATTAEQIEDYNNQWGHFSFDLFAGLDFRTGRKFWPYVETRFTATDVLSFRMSGGFNIMF